MSEGSVRSHCIVFCVFLLSSSTVIHEGIASPQGDAVVAAGEEKFQQAHETEEERLERTTVGQASTNMGGTGRHMGMAIYG